MHVYAHSAGRRQVPSRVQWKLDRRSRAAPARSAHQSEEWLRQQVAQGEAPANKARIQPILYRYKYIDIDI